VFIVVAMEKMRSVRLWEWPVGARAVLDTVYNVRMLFLDWKGKRRRRIYALR